MKHSDDDLDTDFPAVQQRLSGLSPSNWTHQIRINAGRTDYSTGPVALWREERPWGWVTWGFDTTYSYSPPRPEQARIGQLYVAQVIVGDPAANSVQRRQIRSHVAPSRYRFDTRTGPTMFDSGAVAATAGGGIAGLLVGHGLLSSIVDFASLIGAGAGAGIGAGGWFGWKARGGRHIRVWEPGGGVDGVPWWLAYVEELDNATGQLGETLSDLEVHHELARRRWDLLDPNEFDATVDRIREMDAALAEMNQTTSEIAQRKQQSFQQALDELAVDGPDPRRGGLAETIRYRAAGLREVHHLDPDDQPLGPPESPGVSPG